MDLRQKEDRETGPTIPGPEGARPHGEMIGGILDAADQVARSASDGDGGYAPGLPMDQAGASLPQHDTDVPKPPPGWMGAEN